MANNCDYIMKIVGRQASVEELVDRLAHKNDKSFGRIFSLDEIDNKIQNGIYQYECCGDCAWSIFASIIDLGEDNVVAATNELNVSMEIYSNEPGCAFQEHYIISKGKILKDEVVEWQNWYYPELDDKLKEHICHLLDCSLEEVEKIAESNEDYVSYGGFGNYGEWSDLVEIWLFDEPPIL